MNKLFKSLKITLIALIANSCFAAQSCHQESQICVDSSPVKYFNGQAFTLAQLGLSCWKYDKHYNCPLVDTCQSYVNQGCVVDVGQNQCTETNNLGKCVSWNKVAKCDTGQSETNTMVACGNEICKPDASGNMTTCYKADPVTDTDFGSAMAALEVANEMGTMKNCYDKRTGNKCNMTDPNDPSKGADPNCECIFFQGKFMTYKNSFNVWDQAGGYGCKIGSTFTDCDRIAREYGNTTKVKANLKTSQNSKSLLAAATLPTRDVDAWSDKGQLNLSLTGNKDTTGIHAGNPYVYSFASSSKTFDATGQSVTSDQDDWAATNQKNSNLQLAASTGEIVIAQDDSNASTNQVRWNSGGSTTGQGSTAQNSGDAMKVVQDAVKMVSDVLDFGSMYNQLCTAEDQSKMINVGKHHCLFDYDGVPGPENNEWILYTYGDKNQWSYQDCTYQTTFWGAYSACGTGANNYAVCKGWYGTACALCGIGICPGYCSDLDMYCYGQTLGGHGGQDCGGVTGGNDVIFKGKVNCCFSSTISKIITKAAFEQHIGGRPSLNNMRNYVAQFHDTEVCSTSELASGKCNSGNTGINTANTFQAMCERGITISEMQAIDFSRVDFSEFYAEANKGVNTSSFNTNNQTNTNQTNRVTDSINNQKQQNLQLQGKSYFSF